MPNKKGFTLVELLAIIAILAMIMLMTFPAVSDAIKRSKERTYESQVKLIEDSATGYVNKHIKELFPSNGEVAYLSLTLLKENKVIQSKKIVDPKTGEEMNGCVKVSKDLYGQYKVKYYEKTCEEISPKVYSIGEVVYLDPTGAVVDCTSGQEWTLSNTKTTCYKWNVIKDSESYVEMLLDHNTSTNVAWNSSGTMENGPVEVYNKLKTDTASWNKVETLTNSDTVTRSHATGTYTIYYAGMKARFISAQEIANIANDLNWTTTNSSGMVYTEKPWLYQNLSSNGTQSISTGYWTDTNFSLDNQAYVTSWYVSYEGILGRMPVHRREYVGVRPVVRILKSNL